MLHRFKASVLLSVLLIGLSTLVSTPAKAQGNDSMAHNILKFVNEHRTEMGLPELKWNDTIAAAAQAYSQRMASKEIPLGHEGFEDRMGALLKKLHPANAAAENVADGAKTSKEAVELWLHSPGHRKNIEGGYNSTGIGIARASDGQLYFAQIFINKQ